MDVSPEVLRDVEFREQWRGYSPDEVDNYLERLALVIEQLEERLRAADERTARAEARAQESSGAERDLRRTLVLAQRTADAAIAEAQAEATRTTTEADRHATEVVVAAERRASELVADAERRAGELVADAEQRSADLLVEGRRRAVEEEAEARRLLREEVEALHAARGSLQADVDALTAFLDAERSRATADLERQLEWLRAPGRALPDPPRSSGAAVPPPAPVSVDDGLPATAAVAAIADPGAPADDAPPAGATALGAADHEGTGAHAAVPEAEVEVEAEAGVLDAGTGAEATAEADADVDPVAGLVAELGDLVAPSEPVPDAAPAEATAPGSRAVQDHEHHDDHGASDHEHGGADLDLDAESAALGAPALDEPVAGPDPDDTGEHAAIGHDIPWADRDDAGPRGGGSLFDDAAAEEPVAAPADDKYMAQLRTAFDDTGAPSDEDRMLFGRPDDADPYDDAGRFWRRRR